MTTATLRRNEPRDLMIWKEFEPMADGFVPAVPRLYIFHGTRRGEKCKILCRLLKKVSDGRYVATAILAHNVWYLCNDVVRVEDLTEYVEK